MEEEILEQLPSVEPRNGTVFSPFGTPVTAEEVAKRLSDNLYRQLSDGDDGFVLDAVSRAETYVSTILRWLRISFDLDNSIIREVVLMQTLYELHMALGHEEAGREYRNQMKNTVIAAFGSFPDADNTQTVQKAAAASVAVSGHRAGGRAAFYRNRESRF